MSSILIQVHFFEEVRADQFRTILVIFAAVGS